MNMIIIFISKLIGYVLVKLGRGSVYPGKIATKLNPNIIKYFKLPKKIIFVTGTNGKSTIANTLARIYKEAGYKVGHNLKGSNLTLGILTCLIQNSKLNGVIKSDVLVLEIDERYLKYISKNINPTYLIINNISRDQPPRQGHFDFIFEEIKKGINDDIHLILNADDPIVNRFSIYHKGKISYYGLAKNKYSKKGNQLKYDDNLDSVYCPICHHKLKYDYVHYGDVGGYYCLNNDFKRPDNIYEAKWIEKNKFEINNEVINMPNHFIYNIYNLSACYVVATIDGVDNKAISKVLNNLSFKRIAFLEHNNKKYHLLISKNENSVSFNQSLYYIMKEENDKSVVIGFERVSRRYNLTDLSWLWDIDFEVLNDDSVKNVICTGKFAYDIAVRLKYALKDPKKIKICLDADNLIEFVEKNKTCKDIYCLFCFELEKKIKDKIKELL